MIRLLVVADDVTGANDTGVQFARAGLSVRVSVDPPSPYRPPRPEPDVWVVATNSRHLPADEAGRLVEHLVRKARLGGIERVYKKVDSTLRGNVGAELAGLLRAARAKVLPFAPAYPRAGRTTADGRCYLDGVPLDRTSFARDPREPVRTSDVGEVLAAGCDLPVVVVPPGPLGDPPPWADHEICIALFDAATDDDLERIGEILHSNRLASFCAGSAGLAETLARRLAAARRLTAPPPVPPAPTPLLILAGSLEATSLAQVRAGLRADVEALALLPDDCFPVGGARPGRQSVRLAAEAVDAGRSVLLYTVTDARRRQRYLDLAAERGLDDPPSAVARAMGSVAADVLAAAPSLAALAAFGGDTSVATLHALGLDSMRPRGQIHPGVIHAQLDLPGRTLPFVTKSGGFGPEDLVARLAAGTAGEGGP